MLKVFVNDHSTATTNNSKWVEVITDSTTLPSHIYRGVSVDVLLNTYSMIFSVLQRRTLKMLLMSEYNKMFVEKFLQLLKGEAINFVMIRDTLYCKNEHHPSEHLHSILYKLSLGLAIFSYYVPIYSKSMNLFAN